MSTLTRLADERVPRPSPANWRHRAACGGRTELFFASHAERADMRARRELRARAVCLTCPVLDACREWAREHGEHGFWGGESEEERAAAGYAVALPTGRVARILRAARGTPVRADWPYEEGTVIHPIN